MEIFNIKHLSFAYPNTKLKVLNDINLEIHQGDFMCAGHGIYLGGASPLRGEKLTANSSQNHGFPLRSGF